MNFNITFLERYILERISEKDCTLLEILRETKLNELMIQNIITSLLSKNLILQDKRYFRVNKNLNQLVQEELKNKNNNIVELAELTQATIENALEKKDDSFKLKKVYLTETNEKLLKAMLYNIETFLNDHSNKTDDISNKKVIFWGATTYENITNNIL